MPSTDSLPPVDPYQAEQAALERLLKSGYFDRAPSIAAILTYICKEYFAGRASQVKEYTIATEALGRDSSFDQKKDSIVRVEVHRLRKRLRQFYETAGPEHEIEIRILDGVYQPLFQPRQRIAEPAPAPEEPIEAPIEPSAPEPVLVLPPPKQLPPSGKLNRGVAGWILFCIALICLLITAATGWIRIARAKPKSNPAMTVVAAKTMSAPSGPEVRFLAGRAPGRYVDLYGKTWEGDRFVEGGEAVPTRPDTLIKGYDQNLFAARREGEFHYSIPLPAGTYQLRLYFAETEFGADNPRRGGTASRVFNVSINGHPVLRNFDVIADAGGPNIADIRTIGSVTPCADNYLRLDFTGPAILNAVEIRPAASAKLEPIRIVCQSRPHRAPNGTQWEPDQFVQGGEAIQRPLPVIWKDDPQLCQGERYGDFTYTFPVTPGSYTVNLYFAETWFGNIANKNPNDRAEPNSRIFDVTCNGKTLLSHFDIAREAGETYRAIRKEFHGLKPNAQGKLVFKFTPLVNFACVNAIEVLPE